jgi:hypothetical protein
MDSNSPAVLIVRFPAQHVAERAFFDFESASEPAEPPPVGALAAAPSRLCFTMPGDPPSIAFSVEALLDWDALTPRLALNALPPGTSVGPSPGVPSADRTAIEFPYRLLLSPDASARWTHRTSPFKTGERTELWHTRLGGITSPVPVRAVGRRPVPDTLNTSLSDQDLDDLVTLTGDFDVAPQSWQELGVSPSDWRAQLRLGRLVNFMWIPRPLEAEQMILTTLGASVRLRGHWDYPAPDQDPAVLEALGMPIPGLEQYEHVAGLGRDQLVRVVRRGFVHTGQRASIVKVTERRFETVQIGTVQQPRGTFGVFGSTAYLRQYFKVVIQEPGIDYAALAGGYEHHGREMPLRSLRLTTLETPKIDLPCEVSLADFASQARAQYIASHRGQPVDEVAVAREAQQLLDAAFTQPFWIGVSQQDFEFHFTATDWEGETVAASTPLVFVPYEAVGDTQAVLTAFLNGDARRRQRPLGNQSLAIADPTGSARGSTRAPTEELRFTLQEVSAERATSLPDTYRPRWVMAVDTLFAHLEAIERLTGSGEAVGVSFDPAYLDSGLDSAFNVAGVFARIAAPVAVKFGGVKGGGLARPDSTIEMISSRQGALALTFAQPAVSQADLAGLFGDAKLFGTFDLKKILAGIGPLTPDHFSHADLPEAALQQLLDDPMRKLEIPVLRTRPLVRSGRPYAVEARYVWKPNLQALGIFQFDARSELVLDARTVTPLDGTVPRSEVHGELRGFGMSFFGVATVHLGRLAFAALGGRKPDVTAEGLNLQFEGPLRFVNTLRDVLPTAGFSDPPAVQVTPEGISAGYSLGIPTVGVGIFSLQNLSLQAALSVPFVGKPAGVRFAISERHHPFLVTVSLFGGGGFFALGVSAEGVDEIEAAIEFGGNVSLNLGVASGGVYVMAGVYFGRTGAVATLTGYLRCGGYLSVLGLISISVEFYLAFTYRHKDSGGDEVWGQASVKVCVEVVCFSKTVTLTVERRFAGAAGDPTLEDLVDSDAWETYCLAFAAEKAE